MILSYKFRLYPNKEQEQQMLRTLEACRWIYNYFLARINKAEQIPHKYELQKEIPKLRREREELKGTYARVLYQPLHQLYSNLKALSALKKKGKKIGRLRFKGDWFKTFIYNQRGFKLINTGRRLDKLHLSKIGDIPIRISRRIDGKIKQVTIKRYNSGRWFAIFTVEQENIEATKKERRDCRAVGIDVGIKHFLTDSDGNQVENPRLYEKILKRIKIEQRRLSKKQRGSRNYEKQRVKLARRYERLTNQRDDFLHKLSRYYVDKYDVICVEELNIGRMVKVRPLAQKILDASWGKFLHYLSYKAERAGKTVVRVDSRGTSRGLSYKNPMRDYISACRILMRGWGSPDCLIEGRLLLRTISYQEVVSGQIFSMKQEALDE